MQPRGCLPRGAATPAALLGAAAASLAAAHSHGGDRSHDHAGYAHHAHAAPPDPVARADAIASASHWSARAGFLVGSPLDAFLPSPSTCAYYVNLAPPSLVDTPAECAAACLNYTGDGGWGPAAATSQCVLFNVCADGGRLACGLQGYNQNLTFVPTSAACTMYLRVMLRNATPAPRPVAPLLEVPRGNVSLAGGGLLARAYGTNLAYLRRKLLLLDDLLFPYRKRQNASFAGPGSVWAWDGFVPGSCASGALMGLGGVARWTGEPDIVAARDALVDGIAAAVGPDGYAFGYPAADTNAPMNGNNQLPSYVNSWFAHGMLEAGTPAALATLRAGFDWFLNSSFIPQLFPMDGGDGHVGPLPHGFDPANGTWSDLPFAHGHMLYWMGQAGIGHSRLALSPVGTQAEVDFLQQLYAEQWWLRMLLDRNESAVWARYFYPDNYEATNAEAYADLYALTGNATYLQAALNFWALVRDPARGWLFPGGSFAINENFLYPPGSLPLEYNPAQPWGPTNRPVGEMCPSAFFAYLSRRFHNLDPDNETFVFDQERALINVGIAAQDGQGRGVRYFAVLHKAKSEPDFKGSCCEGQNGRLFGGAPEWVFSLVPGGRGLTVNLFEPASIAAPGPRGGLTVNVTLATDWPLGSAVALTIAPSEDLAPGEFDVALRIPQWAVPNDGAGGVAVAVDGAPHPGVGPGAPGTFLHLGALPLRAAAPTVVTANISMAWTAHPYAGQTQLGANTTRVAYMLGPLLMAASGDAAWDAALDCLVINGTGVPGGWDPLDPTAWMVPHPDPLPPGNGSVPGLTFAVRGVPGVAFVPYYAIGNGDPLFTVYPVVVGSGSSAGGRGGAAK